MKKHFLTLSFFILTLSFVAQRGKDGAGTYVAGSNIVNIYTPLTASANIGNTSISVGSSAGFTVGDLIFIIQMQGASVNAGKDTLFPDVNSSIPTNTTYGAITAYNNSGNYEFVQINSIPNGTSINLDCGLQKAYNSLNKVQVIRVPRYTTLSISGGAYITCPQWNGSTGGVTVVEVATNATLTSTPSFNVTGLGFRGGTAVTVGLSLVTFANKWGSVNRSEGAYKGESINGDTTRYQVYAAQHCRGSMANGGGGGDAHNSGGGGGANANNGVAYTGLGVPAVAYNAIWNLEFVGFGGSSSSGGGRGGYSWSNSNQNINSTAPGSGSWGGDARRVVGGFGGRPLDYTLGKLWIGGGGGAGHGNDAQAGSGGNGGGLVYMLCYGNVSGVGTILANGGNGANSITGCGTNDGAGGGGGGGTIVLNAVGSVNLTAPVALSAVGGTGGNVSYNCGIANANSYGPGAGGGGGYIGVTGGLPANTIAGGPSGTQTGNNNNIGVGFPPNGATAGGTGSTAVIPPATTITVNNATTCVNNTATLTATAGTASINWYNLVAGGAAIGSGTQFITPTYTAAGTFTLYAGACPGSYRQPVIITVNPNPTVTANSATVCAGQSAVLTASGAVTYTWSIGPITASISASPTLTTVYTVTGTTSGCNATFNATITATPNPTVSVTNTVICSGSSAVLTASGATSYSWNTGAGTASISVNPTLTTVYTVTGTTGACIDTKTVQVTVNNTPTVSVNSQTICSGAGAVLTASGAVSYSWNTGAATTSISPSPTITTVYTVTGTIGSCSNIKTATVNVITTPTVVVNSATVCFGNSVTISASGATTYSWSTGAGTASISVSPTAATVYTVTGTNGGLCSGMNTSTVTVSPQPTVSLNANNFNICGAQTATIIAFANGTYSWSTGATTNSITTGVAGVYNVTVTNSCGTSIQSATVTSGAAPAFTINPTSTVICAGQTLTLNTAGSSGTFTWSNGAGNTPSITINSSGVYTATLSNPCGVSSYSISITDGPSTALNVGASSTTLCSGGSVTLTASGAGTYSWSTGAGNVPSITVTNTGVYTASVSNSCGNNTATISVINGPSPSVNIVPSAGSFCNGQTATLTANGSSGTYSWTNGTTGAVLTTTDTGVYTAVVSNSCGTGTNTYNVVFQSIPTVSLTASKNNLCPNETATLTANGVNGGTVYSWSSSSNNGNVETVSSAGNYVVTYTNGCGTSTAGVTVNQSTLTPDFNFTPNGGTAPLTITFNNASVNNNTNQWTFGNGQTSGNITGDNSQYTAAGIYTVTLLITNSDGCAAAVSKTLEVTEQGLGIIPEVLTPNGDGKNDFFEIKGIDNYPNNELQIFNRWGNLVYTIKGYKNTWDGVPNKNSSGSGKLPSGTYFYLLNLGDKDNQVFKGFVELLY